MTTGLLNSRSPVSEPLDHGVADARPDRMDGNAPAIENDTRPRFARPMKHRMARLAHRASCASTRAMSGCSGHRSPPWHAPLRKGAGLETRGNASHHAPRIAPAVRARAQHLGDCVPRFGHSRPSLPECIAPRHCRRALRSARRQHVGHRTKVVRTHSPLIAMAVPVSGPAGGRRRSRRCSTRVRGLPGAGSPRGSRPPARAWWRTSSCSPRSPSPRARARPRPGGARAG